MTIPTEINTSLTNPTIAIHGITKSYRQGRREIQALRGLDLTVDPGEFVAIMGASGSGKSTLLHLCGGMDAADTGSLVVAGQNLTTMSERALTAYRRRTVGVIFQQFNLMPSMDVRENILLPAQLAGTCNATVHSRMEELVEVLSLKDRVRHRPDALSGGEQQRVAIARALIMNPPVLLADEPTGNLDSLNAAIFWKLLRRVLETRPMTVLVVTHEPAAAVEAKRVIVLRDGQKTGEFNVEVGDDAGILATRYQALAS